MMTMEFHISRKARDLYQFDQSLFELSGNVIVPNFRAARLFAQKINEKKDLLHFPEQTVSPGQINAMGLIDEILHFVVSLYRRDRKARVMEEALDVLYERLGKTAVDSVLRAFSEQFPPVAVYQGRIGLDA